MAEQKIDIIIVGAGLSGLLTAWRCLDVNPQLRVLILEATDRMAGDHTWSFNLTDIAPELRDWIQPFIAYQWARYDVKFPKHSRTLDIPYCTGNSDSLRACIEPHIRSGRLQLRLETSVLEIGPEYVILESGEQVSAATILDARGFQANENVCLGYQKFVGHVIKTATPHGLENPIIMDATVPQIGGYRFVYCLPYTETEMLVEDTYYTDEGELHSQEIDARIKDYIMDRLALTQYDVLRREKGVLPITLAAKAGAYSGSAIGIGGGFYHAVTGYSFPNALRIADIIANNPLVNISILQGQHYRRERFLRLLNRMLFRAAKPEMRYTVLQRFYGLKRPLIERFYAGQFTIFDKLRILIGKPPVPVTKALYNFSEKAFRNREYMPKDKTKRKP